MRALLGLLTMTLLAGSGMPPADARHRVAAACAYEHLGSVAHERACVDQRRADMAAHDEPPTRGHESLWAFRALVAERRDAGRVSAAEATFAVLDYQRRLEAEVNQLRAARDAAHAAEMGNYLSIWRAYFGAR